MLVTHSLPNWLIDCRLVNLIDVTLACEDGNSKLVEVVTVVDVDDENRVGKGWLQIWKLRFVQTLSTLVKILSLRLVEILMLGWDFEVDA